MDLIKKRAVRIARDERIDYMQFRGAFIYSPAVVRTILEDAVWVDAEDSPDIEGRIDVSRALGELRAEERDALLERFGPVVQGAPAREPYQNVLVERAVDKISMILNRGAQRSELDIETASDHHATPAFA